MNRPDHKSGAGGCQATGRRLRIKSTTQYGGMIRLLGFDDMKAPDKAPVSLQYSAAQTRSYGSLLALVGAIFSALCFFASFSVVNLMHNSIQYEVVIGWGVFGALSIAMLIIRRKLSPGAKDGAGLAKLSWFF